MDNDLIVINGIEYVKKSSQPETCGTIKMVRSYAAGVFFGEVVSEKHEISGLVVELKNATRVWSWKGAASLSQLSNSGTSNPSECRFPEKVQLVKLMNVVEILEITKEALSSLESVKIWKQ